MDSAALFVADAVRLASVDLRSVDAAHDVTEAMATVTAWVGQGWPMVVRRPCTVVRGAATYWCVALCGPRDAVPRRVAVDIRQEHIVKTSPPVALADVIDVAFGGWRPALRAIDAGLAQVGLVARVFGSLAWQAITGRTYLHAGSDVDLVVDVAADAWREGIDPDGGPCSWLARVAAMIDASPVRCDVELRPGAAGACKLAELRQGSRSVMLLGDSNARLIPRTALRGLLP